MSKRHTRNSASTIHDRDKCERCGSFVQGVSFRHRGGDWLCLSCFDASLHAAEAQARAEGWRAGAEAMRDFIADKLEKFQPELGDWRGWLADEMPEYLANEIRALPIPEPGTGEKE